MSIKEASTGLAIAEKFFGLIIILIGALVTYFTYVSLEALSKMFGEFSGIFFVSGLALIAIGVLLLLAKAE
ncbi:MAG: hypothetical protein U9O89_06035 [Thermoproteota archaeon]|nr:hypothetical protein [Thermoproteota archaeon]